MPTRGDYLKILYSHSSGVADTIIAESTSVSIDLSADALETTNQASGLNASFIGGKVSGTASGDYLLASDAAQFTNLFGYMNAGTTFELRFEHNGTVILEGEGILTSLGLGGGLSSDLATGSYSIQFSGDMAP